MKIAVGGDHAGFPMKAPVVEFLRSLGHEVTDHGTHSEEPVDFPDIAQKVTSAILSGEAERGVLVCGTGVGAAIAGNKVPGIRAALVHDTHCAHQGVEHDDVNLACIGAWIIGFEVAKEVLGAFVNAEFRRTLTFAGVSTNLPKWNSNTPNDWLRPGRNRPAASRSVFLLAPVVGRKPVTRRWAA